MFHNPQLKNFLANKIASKEIDSLILFLNFNLSNFILEILIF